MNLASLLALLPVVTIYPEQVNIESRMVGQNKDRQMRTQSGYVNKPGRHHPEFFKFQLTDDQQSAFPAGKYLISAESYGVGDYDVLSINRFGVKLVPLPPELQAVK